ncbi:GIY-YIG nuclease family protein [Prevotella sp. tf2-5]|uniref:GIY-YIG nuclease family protein n=1 Tax=Prevotella sp. tf2-5 TaxID=1761889 RepID=UPI0008F1DEB8|nr:GIY-YIG nuclease family protein [Prevotella sp. tf2-5]SFP05530.1 hypothetical protein SAMN04487852_11437 [Prevotella sp. tf2-5]
MSTKVIHPVGYWSLEKLIEEGKKYHTKGEFKKLSPSAYAKACRTGLIKSMDWFNNGRKKKRGPYKEHKYTKKYVAAIIKEHCCITVTDLRKTNEYAYKQARDNNWLKELGLRENKHEDGYWTENRVWDVAHQYTNKNEFSKHEPVAYKWASQYGLLEKMTWMKSPTYDERRENHDSEVYAYVDEQNKVVYVGLAVDIQNRKRSHKYQKNSAVKKYFGKNIPEPLILKTQLTIDESTYWEDYFKQKYICKGYKILNVAPTGLGTGSIGGIPKWTSKEAVFEESHKYQSRSEFKMKSGGAYNHALSNGWLDEMTWLEKPLPKIKWTREKVFEESHKYQYKGDFCNGSPRAYEVAMNNGWLEEMTWIKERRKPSNYWTRERVFEESHKYTNKKDFEANANTAFQKAMQNGWLKQMPWLMPLPLGPVSVWTHEKIIDESRKYTSKTEFAEKSPTAYRHACEDKSIFQEMPWIVEKKKPDGWWNDKARVMEEGHKYTSRTAFAKGSYSAWKSAKKNGWLDEMTWMENNRHRDSKGLTLDINDV